MIWAGIVGDELIGPLRVPYGVKITSALYYLLLELNLLPWLDEVLLQKRKTFAHSAKAMQHFFASLGTSGKHLMVWPPYYPD